MKTILFICLVAILPTISKAQSVFGANQTEVKDTLLKLGLHFVSTSHSKDGTLYDLYEKDKDESVGCFYNKAGQCYQYRRILDRASLIDEVEYLNKKYIKVDAQHWINKKTTVKVYLFVPDDDNAYYTISYYSLDTPE